MESKGAGLQPPEVSEQPFYYFTKAFQKNNNSYKANRYLHLNLHHIF